MASEFKNIYDNIKEGLEKIRKDFRSEISEPFNEVKNAINMLLHRDAIDEIVESVIQDLKGERVDWEFLQKKYPSIIDFKKRINAELNSN